MRDDDQNIIRPGDRRSLEDARRVRVRIAWRTQPEELVTGVGCDVPGCAQAHECDLPGPAECGSGRVDRDGKQLPAHVHQRRDRRVQNLGDRIGRCIVGAHVAMHVADRPAQRLGQANRQFAESAKAHAAAEADDGGLAGTASLRNLGQGGIRRLARMRQDPVRDAPFGAAQGPSPLFDSVKHVAKLQKKLSRIQKNCQNRRIS